MIPGASLVCTDGRAKRCGHQDLRSSPGQHGAVILSSRVGRDREDMNGEDIDHRTGKAGKKVLDHGKNGNHGDTICSGDNGLYFVQIRN
jgi:hypothetical protein